MTLEFAAMVACSMNHDLLSASTADDWQDGKLWSIVQCMQRIDSGDQVGDSKRRLSELLESYGVQKRPDESISQAVARTTKDESQNRNQRRRCRAVAIAATKPGVDVEQLYEFMKTGKR